jgi:hypothetical protein
MGEIALEADTNEPNLPQRLEQAYFGNTQRPIGMSGQLRAQDVTGAMGFQIARSHEAVH